MKRKCEVCGNWLEWNGSEMYCQNCGEVDVDSDSVEYEGYYYKDYECLEKE